MGARMGACPIRPPGPAAQRSGQFQFGGRGPNRVMGKQSPSKTSINSNVIKPLIPLINIINWIIRILLNKLGRLLNLLLRDFNKLVLPFSTT